MSSTEDTELTVPEGYFFVTWGEGWLVLDNYLDGGPTLVQKIEVGGEISKEWALAHQSGVGAIYEGNLVYSPYVAEEDGAVLYCLNLETGEEAPLSAEGLPEGKILALETLGDYLFATIEGGTGEEIEYLYLSSEETYSPRPIYQVELPRTAEIQPFDRTDEAVYFYDAPLTEFVPSEDFGELFLYMGEGTSVKYWSLLDLYGFCDKDGKIITEPLYSIPSIVEREGKEYYLVCPINEPSKKEEVTHTYGEHESYTYIKTVYPGLLIAKDGTSATHVEDIDIEGNYSYDSWVDYSEPYGIEVVAGDLYMDHDQRLFSFGDRLTLHDAYHYELVDENRIIVHWGSSPRLYNFVGEELAKGDTIVPLDGCLLIGFGERYNDFQICDLDGVPFTETYQGYGQDYQNHEYIYLSGDNYHDIYAFTGEFIKRIDHSGYIWINSEGDARVIRTEGWTSICSADFETEYFRHDESSETSKMLIKAEQFFVVNTKNGDIDSYQLDGTPLVTRRSYDMIGVSVYQF